tara:strand:+ start:337 stop:615 length:279 start_codon:yes stop_codon:yes gene_type:complete
MTESSTRKTNWVRGEDGMWKETGDDGGWVRENGEWKYVVGSGEWKYAKDGKMEWVPDKPNTPFPTHDSNKQGPLMNGQSRSKFNEINPFFNN